MCPYLYPLDISLIPVHHSLFRISYVANIIIAVMPAFNSWYYLYVASVTYIRTSYLSVSSTAMYTSRGLGLVMCTLVSPEPECVE